MPTLLVEHTIYGGGRPPKPWAPTVLLGGGELRGLSLDGRDDETTAVRAAARGTLGGQRPISIARQQDVSIEVDESEEGVVRIRLWQLP